MGDVGSAFLGFVFAVFVIYFSDRPGSVWIWLVLLGLFWFDATLTLYRRYRKGEKLSQAHKKHAYQRIVQAGFSHRKTVITGMLINLVGLIILYSTVDSPWIVPLAIGWMLVLYRIIRYIDRYKPFELE
jgi:Fuc2NAc and GlcNAc transferase